jgi:hypothetical protein
VILEVFNPINATKLATLTEFGVVNLTAQDTLNDVGALSFTVTSDHPDLGDVALGNVVRVLDGSTIIFAARIQSTRTIKVARDGQGGELVEVSCRGLLGDFADSVVQPWVTGRPQSLDRVFNWASPKLNLSSWNSQVWNRPGVGIDFNKFPEAWPVDPALNSWVWSNSNTPPAPPWTSNESLGESLFLKTFTASGTIVIYFAGKRTWDLWLDGVQLAAEPVDVNTLDGYEQTWRYVVNVSSGTHRFAARVQNAGLGLSGMIAACFQVTAGLLDTVIWTSAETVSDWYSQHLAKNSAGAGTFPGFTAPQIIEELLDEAQDRGELAGWTFVTYGTHSEVEEWACRVGETTLSALESLMASYVDLAVDPATLTLGIYPKGELGGTPSVALTPGVNITDLSETVSADFHNAVNAITKTGITSFRTDATSITANGRKSYTLQLPNVVSGSQSSRIIDTYLSAFSTPLRSVTVESARSLGAVAGVNFKVADAITVDGETLKCVGVTWVLAPDGQLDSRPEFETFEAVRQKERQRAIARLIAKFDQPATAQALDLGTQIPSGRVRITSHTWSWSGDVEVLLPGADPTDPASLGQPWRPDRTMRLYELEVEVNSLADATGTSTFEFNRNGSLPSSPFSWGLFNLSLTTTVARASVGVSGFTTVTPNARYSPRCVAAGNHVSGRYTARFADPV